MSLRVAFVCSAGASPLEELVRVRPDINYLVITDRECGAETRSQMLSIKHKRFTARNNAIFSDLLHEELHIFKPDLVFLLFARLLSGEILGARPLLNIHPSLLPAFPGIGALRQAHAAHVRFFGATLHGVTAGVDNGPIIAQAAQPLPPGVDLPWMERQSFLHRTALVMLAVDLFEAGHIIFDGGLPSLLGTPRSSENLCPAFVDSRYYEAMRQVQEREGVRFL